MRSARCGSGLVALCLAAGLVPSGPRHDAHADDYRLPESYLPREQPTEYIAHAREYLEQHPDVEWAPAVLFDMLMVATVHKQDALTEEMKARLVLEHPRSLFTQYLLATSDESKYRSLLQNLIGKLDDDFLEERCRQLARAVELGLRQWGPSFLNGDAFLLEAALVAQGSGNKDLHMLCRAKLLEAKDKTRQVADIFFDDDTPAADKLAALHQVEDSAPAKLLQRFQFSRLPQDDRESPRILRLMVERKLEAGKLAEALPLVDQLAAAAPDAQALFWRGWCHAALGDLENSLADFEAARNATADDAWGRLAADMAGHVRGLEDHLDRTAEALLDLIARARRDGVGQFEGRFEFRPNKGGPVALYAAVIPDTNYIEAVLERDGKSVLAVRLTDSDTRVYFGTDDMIHEFRQRAPFPIPRFAVDRTADGSYSLQYGLNLGSSAQLTASAQKTLLDSPWLTTRDGLKDMLRRTFVNYGWLPSAAQSDESGGFYRWTSPVVRRPDVETWELRLAPDGDRLSLEGPRFSVRSLRFGPAGSFPLAPSEWPDARVVTKDKIDGVVFMRLMTAAFEWLQSDEPQQPDAP